MNNKKTFYEVLGLTSSASTEEIRKAYRQLSGRYHPDNQQSADEQKFIEVQNAYDTLSDQVKKDAYDKELSKLSKLEDISDTSAWYMGSVMFYSTNRASAESVITEALQGNSDMGITNVRLGKGNDGKCLQITCLFDNMSEGFKKSHQDFRAALEGLGIKSTKSELSVAQRAANYLQRVAIGTKNDKTSRQKTKDSLQCIIGSEYFPGQDIEKVNLDSITDTRDDVAAQMAFDAFYELVRDKFPNVQNPLQKLIDSYHKLSPLDPLREYKMPPSGGQIIFTIPNNEHTNLIASIDSALCNTSNPTYKQPAGFVLLAGLLLGAYNYSPIITRNNSGDMVNNQNAYRAAQDLLRSCAKWEAVSPCDGNACYPALNVAETVLPVEYSRHPIFCDNKRELLSICLSYLHNSKRILDRKTFMQTNPAKGFDKKDSGKIAITDFRLFNELNREGVINEQLDGLVFGHIEKIQRPKKGGRSKTSEGNTPPEPDGNS